MAALLVAAALALGILVGPGVTALGVCVAAIVGLGGAVGLISVPTRGTGGRGWWVGVSALCLGVVAAQPRPMPSNPRGEPPSSRDLSAVTVLESAWPGPRCQVLVRGPDGPRLARFRTSACDFGRGDRLWIRPAAAKRPRRGHDPFVAPPDSRALLASRRHRGPNRLVGLRKRAFEKGRRDPAWGLVGAALLGHRRALPPQDRGRLARAGLGHLVAISGLHVGLLGAGLWRLADRLPPVPRRVVMKSWRNRGLRLARVSLLALAVAVVAAFVWVSGHSPPAVRASLGLGLIPLSRWRGRTIHAPTALAVVATAMMLVDPRSVLSASFQLSFAAMAAIVRPGVPKTAWTVSRDVAWATSGIAVLHFGAAAIWGIVLNLVAVPVFAACLVPSSVIGAALWCGPPGLGAVEALAWRLSHGAARLLLDLAQLGAAAPAIPLDVAVGLGTAWVLAGSRGKNGGPPRLGVVSLAVATLWTTVGRAPERRVAFGSTRAPGVVVVVDGDVCIAGVGPSPGQWSLRLDALEIPRGASVFLDAPEPEPPHWAEAARAVEGGGWQRAASSCTPRQREAAQRARAGLRACRHRFGASRIFDDAASSTPCVGGILGRDDGA